MKKILFLLMSVISCNAFGADATYNCTVQRLTNLQIKDKNEFLYVTVADYNDANGRALICGHQTTEGCADGVKVIVKGAHVWDDETESDTMVYQCAFSKGWGDAWSNIGYSSIPECDTLEGKVFVTDAFNGKVYAPESAIVHMTSVYFVSSDFCFAPEDSSSADEVVGTSQKKKSCKDKRDTPEGKACCDLPKETAKWDEVNKKCICSGGKLFLIGKNGRGSCAVSEGGGGAQFRCPATDVSHFARWKTNCASHAATLQLIAQIEALCATPNVTADQYNDLYADVTASVAINCQQVITETITETIEITVPSDSQSRAAIIAAGSALDGIVAGFGEANVWKNAQGEFNTARLASDSIAAVVLGTAGGLITSSVMKKHQVEDGFEDLKCVIGGQPVAGWGDEFRVGIQ